MRILRRGHRHLKPETLSEYLDGRLGSPAASSVEEEIARCPECREELDSLRFTVGNLRSMAQAVPRRDFTLAGAPTAHEGSHGTRSVMPLRMPGWVYVGAAAAAVLAVALLLSGDLPGLVSPGSSPFEEQEFSDAAATVMEIAPLGTRGGDTAVEGEDMSAAATSATLAMAESAPDPDERPVDMKIAASWDEKPQNGPTPASVAAAGEPDAGREATRAATLSYAVEAAAEKSPESEPPIMATVAPSPITTPPTAVTPVAMAAVQEILATSAADGDIAAKEVVKETYRSDPHVAPSPIDSTAVRAGSHADTPMSKSALTADTRPGTAVREVAPTLEILDASPAFTPAQSQATTTMPGPTPTPAQVEKLETKGPTLAVTAAPAVAANEGPHPTRPYDTAESTSTAPAMASQQPILTPDLPMVTTGRSETMVDAEATPEPVSRNSTEALSPRTGVHWPMLLGFSAALMAVLLTALAISAKLYRRRNRQPE